MKVEITQAGVRMDGKELEVGQVVDVKGDDLPESMVNKAAILASKTAITNPAKGAVQQPAAKSDA